MPMLIKELEIEGVANKEIFLEKQIAIHDMKMKKEATTVKEAFGEKSEDVIVGAENG
jgi:hypothetical protein